MEASTQRIPGSKTLAYGRDSYLYHGIIREGRRIIWTCEHEHQYRDQHVYYWVLVHGPSGAALTCAADEVGRRMALAS